MAKQYIKYTILLSIFLMLSVEIIYSQSIPSYDISSDYNDLKQFQVYVIEDTSREMTINDVASGRIKGVLTSSRFYVQSTDINYWFCFSLVNRSNRVIDRVISFDESYAEEATLYYRQDDSWHEERAGLAVPLDQRPVHNRNPIFLVNLQPRQSKTVYMKLHSNYGMLTIGVYCETPESFLNREQLNTAYYMFYFGAACALIIYNFFLFVSLREKLYLYYVLHGLCYITWVLMYSGFDLYTGISESLHYRINSITNFILTFLALFTKSLLQTHINMPKIDKVLSVIAITAFVSGIVSFIEIHYYQYLTFIALPSYFFFMFVGIYASLKRITLSFFYLVSMGLYFTGIILLSLLLMDMLPYNLFTRYFYLPGSLAEFSIFSLALAYRVKLLQNQNIAYQQELIQSERNANVKLEKLVTKRTAKLKKANEELAQIAKIDGLTSLANRRFLNERLNHEWRRLKRERGQFSVIMCDIDHFKKFNDHYGHQEGDECLIKVAKIINQSVRRPGDLAARYGGEEFLILLPNTDTQGSVAIAEKIRSTLEKVAIEHIKSDTANYVTMSFGVASIKPHYEENEPEKLVSLADKALYKAKAQGRNQVWPKTFSDVQSTDFPDQVESY